VHNYLAIPVMFICNLSTVEQSSPAPLITEFILETV
jgi:hypothetical protein